MATYYLFGIILCELYLYPFLREETELQRRKEWSTEKLVPRTHSDVLFPSFSMKVQWHDVYAANRVEELILGNVWIDGD